MTFAILAVAVLLSAIAWSLFVQWRTQRRKLDESEREVADAISRHIELLSAVAAVLVTKGSIALAAVMMLAACTKEGNTIYEWDPNEPKASTKPLVTVIYGQDALGDRSYNDLIYQGVEEAAAKYGLRTMQLSPTSYDEGRGYLESMFQTVKNVNDTVRRLFIVCAAGYDDYIRQNSHLFDSNPNADLLYLETPEPLASGGSTLYLPYYGAMYEAGAIMPALMMNECMLLVSNPEDATVNKAAKGFTDGFQTDYYQAKYEWGGVVEKHLETRYLAEYSGEGYNIPDSTAFHIINEVDEVFDYGYIVPICGGSGTKLRYLCELTYTIGGCIGIDVVAPTQWLSILKHIDRAVALCVGQWLSPEGMPKHQVLGLKEGYTEVAINSALCDLSLYNEFVPEELRQQIHEDAIRKEAEYDK